MTSNWMGSDRYFSSGHVFHFYSHEIVPIKRMDNFYSHFYSHKIYFHFYSHKIYFHFYSHEIVPIKRILGWIMVNNFGINSLMSNPLTWLGSRIGIFHENNFSLEKRLKLKVVSKGLKSWFWFQGRLDCMCFSLGFPVSDFSDIFLSWRFSHTCAHPEKNNFATILFFSGFFGHFKSWYYQDLKCTKNQCAVIVGMHCSVGEWSKSCLHTHVWDSHCRIDFLIISKITCSCFFVAYFLLFPGHLV